MQTSPNWQRLTLYMKMLRLRFTAARMERITSSRLGARKLTRSKSWNIYRHTSDTPLSVFIDCITTNRLDRLIRSGRPPYSEIVSAWDNLYGEYCDLMNTHEYRLYMLLTKEIGYLKSKMLAVACCIDILRLRHSDRAVAVLRANGYTFAFDYHDAEAYSRDLHALETRSKSLNVAYKIKQKQIAELQGAGGEKLTADDFAVILTTLGKYIGYRIDPQAVTVSEFAAIRRAFDREIEHQQKEKVK